MFGQVENKDSPFFRECPAGIWVQRPTTIRIFLAFLRSRFIVIIYGNDGGVILELDLLFTETPGP